MSETRVRLFIAMPGTNMGSSAQWKEPAKIKTHLFAKVAESLQRKLGKPVELVIEKDKVLGGPIHASMFYDAMESDVYIADLTGNNPNVYLELGARWALRDCVTVVVSQNVEEILFNAAASRAIQYSKDPDDLENAIQKIVQAIFEAFVKEYYCDSPVRKNADIVAYDRKLIDQIKSENEQLKAERGEDLFAAARAATTPGEQLRLLREAARINPSRADILIALGIELRKQAHFDESVAILKQAILLDPKRFESHRELGVTYGKMGEAARAVESLSEAVRLAPRDPETLRNSGGSLRRWGLRDAPNRMDWDTLRMARDRYAAAAQLEPYDTYALLNMAKLDLIISKAEPSRLSIAMKQFEDLRPLCQFNVTQKPEDPWRRFDLADTYLFSSDYAKAKDFYIEAINTIKNKHRPSYLTTVVAPFHELLAIEALSADFRSSVQDVAKMIDDLIQTGDYSG